MINKIFGLFIIVGIGYAIMMGRTSEISNLIIGCSSKTIELTINIFGFMALWLGIINIANKSGLLKRLSKLLRPLLGRLFPSVTNDEALDYISITFIANLFGLGNAATPFALKTMESLKKLNNSDSASDSMITFLIMNTASLTLIPTTIIGLRANYGAKISIIGITLVSSIISFCLALIINYIFRKGIK